MGIVYGPKWSFYSCCDYIGLLRTGFMQVLYLGRAPRTKETLPDFLKWRRVTRHPLVFRVLTGSQRTPGFRVSHRESEIVGAGNKGFRRRFKQRVLEIVSFVIPGLLKASSSLQEVRIIPTLVYFPF